MFIYVQVFRHTKQISVSDLLKSVFFFVPFLPIIPLSESSYHRIAGRRAFLDFWGGLLVFFYCWQLERVALGKTLVSS